MISQLLYLTWLFAKISFFTFGGGYAMIPLFQSELVYNHNFLSATEFANLTAMAQITPGPIGMNSATYIGFQQGVLHGGIPAGILFAFFTTVAVLLPSLCLMLAAVVFLRKYQTNDHLQAALGGLRAATVGLIGAAVLFFADTSVFTRPVQQLLGKLLSGDTALEFGISVPCLIVFILALILQIKLKWNVFLILCISAVLGVLLNLIPF